MKKKDYKKQTSNKEEQQYQDGHRKRKLQPVGKKPKYRWQEELAEMAISHLLSFA